MPSTSDLPGDQISSLGPTVRFKGELRADEDLLIRGHVDGSITHSKHLTICREARVKADIKGQIVAVEGTVTGDITAAVSIAVLAGSRLTGDVHAPSVSVVEGADFNGRVVMDKSAPSQVGQLPRGRNVSGFPSEPSDATKGR